MNNIFRAVKNGAYQTTCSSHLIDNDRKKINDLGYNVESVESGHDYSQHYKRWHDIS